MICMAKVDEHFFFLHNFRFYFCDFLFLVAKENINYTHYDKNEWQRENAKKKKKIHNWRQ